MNSKKPRRVGQKQTEVNLDHIEVDETEKKIYQVHQKPKITFDLKIGEFPWTEKQQNIIETALSKNHKMTTVNGVYGSGKTLLAVYCCLQLLQKRKISNILYLRNALQSGSGTLGWLGGDLATRLSPYMVPFHQKLEELLPASQVTKLIKENIVESQAAALIRGTSFNSYGIILDEIGCMTEDDIILALSRVGKFSHVFCVGSTKQTDIYDSGFQKIYKIFDDEESRDNGVFSYELNDEMDIQRSEFVRFVMRKMNMTNA